MTVATIIRDQIGGKALYMLGAKNLLDCDGALSFRVRGSKAVNYVKVTLTDADLYDVEYGKVWGTKYTVKAEDKGIYVDMLHASIEKNTGLYTSL